MEPTGSRVLGLDISLTSTGISDGLRSDAIQAGPLRGEARMSHIAARIAEWVSAGARLAVIEGPAYGRGSQSGHDELAGLRWAVRYSLWVRRIPIAVVAPTALKKYTTGKGQATKEDMVAAAHERWGVDFSGVKVGRGRHDMADAYALAKMGEAFLNGDGYPAVDWPEVTR